MKIEYKPILPEFQKWKCPYQMKPIGVCIHNTANHASADNEISYMSSSGLLYKDGYVTVIDSDRAYTSYHYAVDEYKAIQAIPHNRNAWHAGDGAYGAGNRNYIAIEICKSEYDSDREAFEKAQENAAELVAMILYQYNWGWNPDRIKKHEDFSKKHCPHRTLDYYGWDYFIKLCEVKYKMLENLNNDIINIKKSFDVLTQENKTLKADINSLKAKLTEVIKTVNNNPSNEIYKTLNEVPKYYRKTISMLINSGKLKGRSQDNLALSETMCRILTIINS